MMTGRAANRLPTSERCSSRISALWAFCDPTCLRWRATLQSTECGSSKHVRVSIRYRTSMTFSITYRQNERLLRTRSLPSWVGWSASFPRSTNRHFGCIASKTSRLTRSAAKWASRSEWCSRSSYQHQDLFDTWRRDENRETHNGDRYAVSDDVSGDFNVPLSGGPPVEKTEKAAELMGRGTTFGCRARRGADRQCSSLERPVSMRCRLRPAPLLHARQCT